MKLCFDNATMRMEILKYLSPGMPIENARRIMEDSGFKFEDAFATSPPCLHCWTVYPNHSLWVSDEIHVDLYHESGKLTEISIDCHSVGP